MLRISEYRNSIQICYACELNNRMPYETYVFGIDFNFSAFLFLIQVFIYDALYNFPPRPVSKTMDSNIVLLKPSKRSFIIISFLTPFSRLLMLRSSLRFRVILSDTDMVLINFPDISYLLPASFCHLFEINGVISHFELKLWFLRFITFVSHEAIVVNKASDVTMILKFFILVRPILP